MLDNVIASKLYRPGSVGYVSRSGGLSNELNSICARVADGVYEGVAIGGDRFPGSTFSDHIFRFEDDPNVRLLVLLGEVGGEEEYLIADAVKSGRIKKPLIAWCIGTCAKVCDRQMHWMILTVAFIGVSVRSAIWTCWRARIGTTSDCRREKQVFARMVCPQLRVF